MPGSRARTVAGSRPARARRRRAPDRLRRLRRRADAAEFQLDQRLRDLTYLADLVGVGIVRLTDDLRVEVANTAAHVFLRREPASMLGRTAIEALGDHRVEGDRPPGPRGGLGERRGDAHDEIRRGPAPRAGTLVVRARRSPILGVWLVLEDVAELRRLQRIRAEFIDNLSHELRTPITTIGLLVESLARDAEGAEARDRPCRRRCASGSASSRSKPATLPRWLPSSWTSPGSRAAAASSPRRRRPRPDRHGIRRPAAAVRGAAGRRAAVERGRRPAAGARRGRAAGAGLRQPRPQRGEVQPGRHGGAGRRASEPAGCSRAGSPTTDRASRRWTRRGSSSASTRRIGRGPPVAGRGSGLAIARHIVEGHGGVIRVDSEEGRGSDLRVHDPHLRRAPTQRSRRRREGCRCLNRASRAGLTSSSSRPSTCATSPTAGASGSRSCSPTWRRSSRISSGSRSASSRSSRTGSSAPPATATTSAGAAGRAGPSTATRSSGGSRSRSAKGERLELGQQSLGASVPVTLPSGTRFDFVVTHLHHEVDDEAVRADQSAKLIGVARRTSTWPLVVVGDFNAEPVGAHLPPDDRRRLPVGLRRGERRRACRSPGRRASRPRAWTSMATRAASTTSGSAARSRPRILPPRVRPARGRRPDALPVGPLRARGARPDRWLSPGPRPLRLGGRTHRARGDWRAAPENSLAAMVAALEVPGATASSSTFGPPATASRSCSTTRTSRRVQGPTSRHADPDRRRAARSTGSPASPRSSSVRAATSYLDVELKEKVPAAIDLLELERGRVDDDDRPALPDAVVSSFDIEILRWLADERPTWPRWLNAIDLFRRRSSWRATSGARQSPPSGADRRAGQWPALPMPASRSPRGPSARCRLRAAGRPRGGRDLRRGGGARRLIRRPVGSRRPDPDDRDRRHGPDHQDAPSHWSGSRRSPASQPPADPEHRDQVERRRCDRRPDHRAGQTGRTGTRRRSTGARRRARPTGRPG